MKLVIKNNKMSIGIGPILVVLLLYANVFLTNADSKMIAILILAGVSFYCLLLCLKNREILKNMFNLRVIRWIFAIWIMFLLYGLLGPYKSAYSFGFHMINFVYIILFTILCISFKRHIVELLSVSFSLFIIIISIHMIVIAGGRLSELLMSGARIGTGGIGNVNTSAILYGFLLLPLFYQVFVQKNMKFAFPMVIGIIFMLFTGSKKAVVSILIVGLVYLFGNSESVSKNIKKFIKILIPIIVILIVVYSNDILHELIWERMESMFRVLNNYSVADQSSTGLRITFIMEAFKHAWEKPLFGHGWGAFAMLYGYNKFYQVNMYSHCNYTEILFSFGVLGFLLYYFYPIQLVRKSFADKRNISMLAKMMVILFMVFDITTVSCYDIIFGYLGYIIASIIIQIEGDKNAEI